MKVLLTGAAGLIGMALRPMLARRGHTVVACDITTFGRIDPELMLMPLDERPRLDRLILAEEIDAIVHCGAISGPMLARGRPMKLVAANIDSTALLLDIAREQGVRRFVFCSSISVYGDVGAADITEATPLRPTSVYGATKVACEQLIQGFGVEYGLSGASLRLGRVYGPYRRGNCHLNTLIRNSERGVATDIPCDAGFVYHYVYVDDVAEAIMTALEAPKLVHREYNIGSGEALTMPEIIDAAARALPGLQARLIPGADDVPDVQTVFDVSRAGHDLAWTPRFRIADGLVAYRDAVRAGTAAA
jgi:UDP-glucuronate 4-epimerase